MGRGYKKRIEVIASPSNRVLKVESCPTRQLPEMFIYR